MDWTLNRVEQLVKDEIGESLHLDFKDSRQLAKTRHAKRELAKDVSAMANAAGGNIIIGVGEKPKGVFWLDGGVDEGEFDGEWLDNVLGSIIRPRIVGLKVTKVDKPEAPGRVLYVLEIPQSRIAPHMTADDRYYRRRNVTSSRMEEYEVREMYRTVEGPELRLSLEVMQRGHDEWVPLQPTVLNDSVVPAELYRAEIMFPASLRIPKPDTPWELLHYSAEEEWQGHDAFQKVAATLTGSFERATAFLGVVVSLPEFRVNVARVDDPAAGVAVIATILAPHMLPRASHGRIRWEKSGWTVELGEWHSGTKPLYELERSDL